MVSDEIGEVEAGVRETYYRLGIKTPKTAAEMMAIHLAKAIDKCKDADKTAGLSRELRQWLEEVRNQPIPSGDFLEDLVNRQ